MDRFFRKSAPVPIPSVTEITPLHPFYPLGVEIKNYVANDRDVLGMLTIFLGSWAVILSITWVITGWLNPRMKNKDKAVLNWFVLSMGHDCSGRGSV